MRSSGTSGRADECSSDQRRRPPHCLLGNLGHRHRCASCSPPQSHSRTPQPIGFKSQLWLMRDVTPVTSEDVAKYARMLAVVQRCERIHSRLKVHKIFYVLKSLGYPVHERFEYRQHGPYSDDLASDLQSAVNATYIEETMIEVAEEGDEEPYRRYDYSIGRRGAELIKRQFSLDSTLSAVADAMARVAEGPKHSPPIMAEPFQALICIPHTDTHPQHSVSLTTHS